MEKKRNSTCQITRVATLPHKTGTLVKQSHTLDCLVFSTTVTYLVGYELELFFALRCLMCVSLEQPRPLLRPHIQQAFETDLLSSVGIVKTYIILDRDSVR